MTENVNKANNDNVPALQMDMFLELLGKTIVLVGQYMNTIMYERRKNIILGVTGTSTKQVTALLKEKALFLQKHTKNLFRRNLQITQHEPLKLRSSLLNQLQRSASRIVASPLEGAPLTKARQIGLSQKQYHKRFNDKFLSFERNRFLSQQNITSKSNTNKHKGLESCSSTAKKTYFKTRQFQFTFWQEDCNTFFLHRKY